MPTDRSQATSPTVHRVAVARFGPGGKRVVLAIDPESTADAYYVDPDDLAAGCTRVREFFHSSSLSMYIICLSFCISLQIANAFNSVPGVREVALVPMHRGRTAHLVNHAVDPPQWFVW